MDQTENGSENTRQRVLEAAGEVFAEKGFAKATIREIVDRARANINAVNYYFRDKRGLYVALFEHAHEIVGGKDSDVFAMNRHLPPEGRLRAMIAHVLHGFILTKRAPWEDRLMLREMIEPTGVIEIVVERFIQPRFEELVAIVRELVPRHTSRLSVQLCAQSILGQCVHIARGRHVVSRLIPELDYTPAGIEKLTDHVTSFSLAAVRNLPSEETEE